MRNFWVMSLYLLVFSIALLVCSTKIYSNFIQSDKGKRDVVPDAGTAIKLQQLSDTIKWSPDYKLKVSDFKELTYAFKSRRYDTSKFGVLAYSSVAIGYSFRTENRKLLVDAFGVFIRSKSWMETPNESTLRHEQGHFDITEIYARKFEKALREMNTEDRSFWASFQKTYEEINALHLKEQDKYDDYAITGLGQDYYYKKILDDLKVTD